VILTDAERVYIARRRYGATQSDWAEAHDVTVGQQGEIERGEIEPAYPAPRVGRPTRGERCSIFRRRLGLTVKQAAAEYGRSRLMLLHYEADRSDARAYEDWLRGRVGA